MRDPEEQGSWIQFPGWLTSGLRIQTVREDYQRRDMMICLSQAMGSSTFLSGVRPISRLSRSFLDLLIMRMKVLHICLLHTVFALLSSSPPASRQTPAPTTALARWWRIAQCWRLPTASAASSTARSTSPPPTAAATTRTTGGRSRPLPPTSPCSSESPIFRRCVCRRKKKAPPTRQSFLVWVCGESVNGLAIVVSTRDRLIVSSWVSLTHVEAAIIIQGWASLCTCTYFQATRRDWKKVTEVEMHEEYVWDSETYFVRALLQCTSPTL